MIRKLLLLAGAASVLAIACLTGAALLARHDGAKNGYHVKFGGATVTITCPNDKASQVCHKTVTPESAPNELTAASRSFTEDLATRTELRIDLPANVVYTQGPTQSVKVEGAPSLVTRLAYDNGRLYLRNGPEVKSVFGLVFADGHLSSRASEGNLTVTITAPSVKRFDLTGAGDIDVRDYDQPELELNLSGAGNLHATGRTHSLRLHLSGAGNADLSKLNAVDADASISGLGNAMINASGSVTASISGAGNITLKQRPANLDKHVSGLGQIEVRE